MTKFFKSPSWYLFLLTAILEIVALVLVYGKFESICVVAFEISSGIMVFLLFIFLAIILDIDYVIGMIFMEYLGNEPLSIMYNFVIGACCLAGSIYLICTLTSCGNPDQSMIQIGGILGLVAAILHLINAGVSHWQLPEEETYKKMRRS